jgi:hypothetical protein
MSGLDPTSHLRIARPWSYFELRRRSRNLKAELSPICLNAGGAESALGPNKAAQLARSSFFIFGFPAKAADRFR